MSAVLSPQFPVRERRDARPASILSLIHEQVAENPDAVAVRSIASSDSMTYGELWGRAGAIADELLKRGVGTSSRVGLLATRTPALVAAMVGVLRCGAAYVPIDPAAPRERREAMARIAGVHVVLGEESDLDRVGDCEGVAWGGLGESTSVPAIDRSPDGDAYVLFTSGSSGQPKGVVISDANLSSYVTWAARAYGFTAGGRTLVHSPVTFDFTVTTLFCPLVRGGVLELLEDDQPGALAHVLRSHKGFDVIKLTPAHLQLLGRQLEPSDLSGVARTVVLGGEALYWRQVEPWQRADDSTRFVNEYGPTETTVGCCVHWLARRPDELDAPVPIGRPIDGVDLHIVDNAGNAVQPGDVGEIWVSGPGVASGYEGAGTDDASRFRHHDAWGRVYRTGDLARESADGLVYLGRIDDQIKIRGHRIEPADVEAAIAGSEWVREVVVSAPQRRDGRERRLIAHVVAEGEPVPVDLLRAELLERLPAHMVPAVWTWVEELPLTKNGKVDRRALPMPGRERPLLENLQTQPSDGLEQSLVLMCGEILELSAVGVHDDLLDLGADSLTLAEVAEQIEALLGVAVPLEHLFEYPTVAATAIYVRDQREQPA